MTHWWTAFRPKTLSAAVVPVVVGTALVPTFGGEILWWVTGLALFAALMIQLATNLFNDVIDFKKGADTEARLGPTRVTQSGMISEKGVFWAAIGFLLLAFLAGIPLVLHGGWPIVAIGLVSLFLAYAYTGGPFPLAYLGLGEIFVVLFFGLIAVGGVFYLHTLSFHPAAAVAGLQVGFLATALLVINNIRDREQDLKAHKKTLAVRFGLRFSRVELLLIYLLSFGLGAYWFMQGLWLMAFLPLVVWPLVRQVIHQVFFTQPGAHYNELLGKAAAIHVLFGVQLVFALVVSGFLQWP